MITEQKLTDSLRDPHDPYAALKERLEEAGIGHDDDPHYGWLFITVNRTVQVKVLHPNYTPDGCNIYRWAFHYRSDAGLPWSEAWLSAGKPLDDVMTMVRDIIAEVLGE